MADAPRPDAAQRVQRVQRVQRKRQVGFTNY